MVEEGGSLRRADPAKGGEAEGVVGAVLGGGAIDSLEMTLPKMLCQVYIFILTML